ncbi:MAG TPA: carbon starvation CstA family protein, partial [Candidatus Eisenbacteria bacterium]|nr:carbon starvation CstA family protein [Candidatus Eisenbacteria bacterium]
GYLGGFVLYTALAAGLIGVLLGGFTVEQPAWKTWNTGTSTGMLFPFLFVTIACGACSGFHGLVCSGTTSKQVARESHMRPVGYGAMLAEGFVALIALVTIMIASSESVKGLSPGTIYGNGIGRFLTVVIGEERLAFATTFGAMAFSTFVFDTLDVCTRLGRYILQELLGRRGRMSAAVCTLVFMAVPAYVLMATGSGGWVKFWTLFGASNQLLAALTLITLTVWLRRSGRPYRFVLVPMVFVFVVTLWALGQLLIASLRAAGLSNAAVVNAAAAAAFIVLALFLASRGFLSIRRSRAGGLDGL